MSFSFLIWSLFVLILLILIVWSEFYCDRVMVKFISFHLNKINEQWFFQCTFNLKGGAYFYNGLSESLNLVGQVWKRPLKVFLVWFSSKLGPMLVRFFAFLGVVFTYLHVSEHNLRTAGPLKLEQVFTWNWSLTLVLTLTQVVKLFCKPQSRI